MIGANGIDPEMLKGDWLFNLDSGDYHNFCIGCAGGARLSFEIPFAVKKADGHAYSVRLGGLKGGHSGVRIHEKRGNALILLSQFLQKIDCYSVSSLNGGSADNAIPADAVAEIVSPLTLEQIEKAADEFRKESAETFDAPESYHIRIAEIPVPETVIDPDLMSRFIKLTATVPNEVFEQDSKLNIVKTSSNFASVHTDSGLITIHTSQRSLEDPARENITELIRNHFAPLNPNISISGIYPGWPANAESDPIKFASGIHQEMFGTQPGIYALHAGLETGAFAKKNPALQIISFGPEEDEIHTERERLHLKHYEEFNQLLCTLIERAATL